MSYVLDALKKAEKDRNSRRSNLGLENLNEDDWNQPPSAEKSSGLPTGIWLSIFAFLSICILVLFVRIQPQSVLDAEVTATRITEKDGQEVISIIQPIDPNTEEAIQTGPNLETQFEPPISLAERIDAFRFEGSLFIEGDPEASRVFIDGSAYRVGDALQDGIYLIDISVDSATLSDGYEQIIHSLR